MATPSMANQPYCGRFAPTPSGPLHFGSLVAALASYLDAKAHAGRWLVRIEDIDEPRAVAGADQVILQQLERFGLHWDGDVIYQSQRKERYRQALAELQQQHLTYPCNCTRKQIKARGEYYTGHCRAGVEGPGPYAIRYLNQTPVMAFTDGIQGEVNIAPAVAGEDFVLLRRDGWFTYQLAVVIDDIDQGVTDIVRGADLLTATSWQINLWRHFSQRQPHFKHIPLALDEQGQKLSKQNHAPALNPQQVSEQLWQACQFLQLTEVPLTNPADLLSLATQAWRAKFFPETSAQDTITR